jgi:hypothetical protein
MRPPHPPQLLVALFLLTKGAVAKLAPDKKGPARLVRVPNITVQENFSAPTGKRSEAA